MEDDLRSKIWNLVAIVFAVIVVAWLLYGGTIKSYFVLRDLNHYATSIRHSELSLACKINLLELLYNVEDEVRDGGGTEGWGQTDEAIREMLDGEITEDEASLVHLELRRALSRASDD